ncbi:MAG: M48 metallopeptidase family protein [Senegalia sp. (in: firmicutes)]
MVFYYIVVHEMCHMIYFNHSKDFWNLVERIMHDYRDGKE